MTQVRSSGGAVPPFATPVSKGKSKAAAQPDKKIAVPRSAQPRAVGPVAAAAAPGPATRVSFGNEALHALAATGEFIGKAVLTGIEDVGEAAYDTARMVGNGVVDVAKGIEHGLVEAVHEVGAGMADTATAIGHGIVHVEHAAADVWGVATQGASAVTGLATTLGNDAQVAVTSIGTAATDVGVSAKAVLSGVGSIASTAANYGTYIVKQGGKVLDELT